MPIRINLLAEQQAAEEARRRDPVKRAILAGGALVAAVLLWSGSLQFQVSGAKSELSNLEAEWLRMEPTFLQVSNNNKESELIRKKLISLERYTTNRFFWAPPLSALQFVASDQVRVVTFSGSTVFKEEKGVLVSTNLTALLPPKPWWKVWAAKPTTNIDANVKAALAAIRDKPDFQRFQSDLIIGTNVSQSPIQVVARIEVTKPETVSERPALVLHARDYSQPPGSQVDKFNSALTNHAFFAPFVGRTNNTVQPEIRLEEDPSDLITPNTPYIPFTVEFRFPERIRANE